jgi:hypothetical protein
MKILARIIVSIVVFVYNGTAASISDWNRLVSTESLSVYIGESVVGSMVSSISTTKSAVIAEAKIITAMADGAGGTIRATILERRTFGDDGQLIQGYQEMSSPAGKNSWNLVKEDEIWYLSVNAGGELVKKKMSAVNESNATTYAIMSGILDKTIKRGDHWRDSSVELTSGEVIYVKTRCIEVPDSSNQYLWKFYESNSVTGKDEIAIFDTSGNTVSREMFPFVFKKKSTSQSAAKSDMNIFDFFRISSERAADVNELIRVSGDSGFVMDTSVAMFFKKDADGYILLEQASVCSDSMIAKSTPDTLQKFTGATAVLQVNHKDIKKLSNKFMNSNKTECSKIESMNLHVFKLLRKEYTAAFSSALETLKAGFGDCGEHSVLLAALLRASGIPARVVFGLIYMPEKKGYYYHAWVMAYNNIEWIFADPAFGVFPAGRDRVPLMIDDSGEKMVQLVRVIGRLTVSYIPNK